MSFSYRYENALDLNAMSDRQVLLFALMQLIQRRCLFCRNKKVFLTEQSFTEGHGLGVGLLWANS